MNEEYKPINNLWKDSEGYRYFGTLKLSSKIKYDGDDFIPLWEWINQLQKENKRLNGTIQTYDILLKSNVEENKQLKKELECTIGIVEHNGIISEKNKEIHQLKDNWNKLKKFLKNTRKENLEWDKKHNCEWQGYNAYYELLIKMQKLEQGSDE